MALINPVPGTNNEDNNAGYASDSGLDIAVTVGTKCVAAADGVVEYAENEFTAHHVQQQDDTNPSKPGYQVPWSVRIRLDDPFQYKGTTYRWIWYTHLTAVDDSIRDKFEISIKAGDPIGLTGFANGEAHLHFGILADQSQYVTMPFQDVADVIWSGVSPDDPTLKINSSGSAVGRLQKMLGQIAIEEGKPSINPKGVDEDFEDDTKNAVVAFQLDRRLSHTDGIVDLETWNALRTAVANLNDTVQPQPGGIKVWKDFYAGLSLDNSYIPRKGLINDNLKPYGLSSERLGDLAQYGDLNFVKGNISWFGGANDTDISDTEEAALTNEVLKNLPAKDYYCAMRWAYDPNGRDFWANRLILVINPANQRVVIVRAIDWGPNPNTVNRILDLSQQALVDLSADTDAFLLCAFAKPGSALGPIR